MIFSRDNDPFDGIAESDVEDAAPERLSMYRKWHCHLPLKKGGFGTS